MTKIKKSIWSVVVGVVMSLALVFGVFAGVNTNKVAKADYNAQAYINDITIIVRQFEDYYDLNNDPKITKILVRDVADEYILGSEILQNEHTEYFTPMEAYNRLKELFTGLLANNPELNKGIVNYCYNVYQQIDSIVRALDTIIEDINGTEEEGQLGYMVNRDVTIIINL